MRSIPFLSITAAMCLLISSASAQNPPHPPAIGFETMLDTFFNEDNGIMRFDQYVVAFAPESGMEGEVVVMNEQRKVVARFPFLNEYKSKDGVFARAAVRGPAEITLSEAGVYNLFFVIGGKLASRMPFAVACRSDGDPLNPKTHFSLDGPWSQVGHFTMKTQGAAQVPILSLWLGSRDLPADEGKGMFRASLYRGDELIAISKKNLGHIAAGHYKRTTIELWHHHDDSQPQTAKFFTKDDLVIDGQYELRVKRQSDDATLRSFKFEVANGSIKQMPQTALAHEPALDYMTPRVARKNSNTFEMIEAIWLESK